MEQGEGVVVDMELEVVRLEIGCMGASTPGMVHSTKVVEEYMVEILGWHVGNGIEVQNIREKVWTMKDKRKGTNEE